MDTDDPDFAALDVLLEQALELTGAARDAFVEEQAPATRAALVRLLEQADSPLLAQMSDAVAGIVAGATAAAPGLVAGDWALRREIGTGGTGQVFYAERRESAPASTGDAQDAFVQQAAVKILWSHRVSTQFRDRFLRERRILASIDHPGLARFLDGGVLEDGRPWFAMEYVEGQDIVTFCNELPIRARLALFAAVAETIDYAHQRLIVHRDIKPQNILVDARGQPRVLDFGIARIVGELDEKELTQAQGTPVTLQYASPEQVNGQAIDVASDVYQLGLLLFEMLTLSKPYAIDPGSLQQAVDTIGRDAPPAPSTRATGLAADVDAIVGKALRKRPRDRYPSAAAMAADVRLYLDGRPIEAKKSSRLYVLSRFLRRNALPVAISATALTALSIATVVALDQAREARAEAERSRATQQILTDVFNQADPFGDGGADVTLAQALVRAKPDIEAKVAADPRLAWDVSRTLAEIFSNLDLLELEREAYEDAWEAARALQGDNERERLYAIAGLGNMQVRSDPAAALEFFAEHLPAAPQRREGALEWLSAKYAQVSAYFRLRDYARADAGAMTMQRVAVEHEIEEPRTLARIEQLLAGAARRAGRLEEADTHWAGAIEHMRRADKPLGLAVLLSNQALHYGMTERFAPAEVAFEESLAIFRAHAPDNTSHANVLRLYAGLRFRQGDPAAALRALDESLAILQPDKQAYAYYVAQQTRARFAFAIGDSERAFDAIERSVQVAAPSFGAGSEVSQRVVPVLARLLLYAGETRLAAQLAGVPVACGVAPVDPATLEAAVVDRLQTNDDSPGATLWAEIDRLRPLADTQGLDASTLEEIYGRYRRHPDPFLDPLERRRLLTALSDLALDPPPVAELTAELETLTDGQRRLRDALRGTLAPRLHKIMDLLEVQRCG